MRSEDFFKIENNILIGKEVPINDSCMNIGQLILNAFKSRPDFIGQIDAKTGEENTFQQMRERSVKCALWLKKIGVQRNDGVVVYTSNHLDTYIPYFATLYIGAVLHVWNINDQIHLGYHLQAGPKVIFTDVNKVSLISAFIKMMNISTRIVIFMNEMESEHKTKEEFISLKCILNNKFEQFEIDKFSCTKLKSSKDIAIILFSSGSTNMIKQHVTISHEFFTAPSNQQIPVMSSNDVGLWVESLHWNISLLLTVRAILSFVKAVKINIFLQFKGQGNIISESDCEYFFSTIEKYKVNWVFLKNGMSRGFVNTFDDLLNTAFIKYDISSLKHIIIGGRQLYYKAHLLYDDVLKARITHVYCLPETGVIAYQSNTNSEVSSSGHVSNNVSLLIADPNTGSALKSGVIGTICCKSPSLTNGYLSSMSGNLEAVTDSNGWFYTDDVGEYDSVGNIYVYERHRNLIVYKNIIYFSLPITYEFILKAHDKVEDVCVIPIYESNIYHLHIAVQPKRLVQVTEDELLTYIETEIIMFNFKVSVDITFMSLPYLRNRYPNRALILARGTKCLEKVFGC